MELEPEQSEEAKAEQGLKPEPYLPVRPYRQYRNRVSPQKNHQNREPEPLQLELHPKPSLTRPIILICLMSIHRDVEHTDQPRVCCKIKKLHMQPKKDKTQNMWTNNMIQKRNIRNIGEDAEKFLVLCRAL